jgi:hypothetical protein
MTTWRRDGDTGPARHLAFGTVCRSDRPEPGEPAPLPRRSQGPRCCFHARAALRGGAVVTLAARPERERREAAWDGCFRHESGSGGCAPERPVAHLADPRERMAHVDAAGLAVEVDTAEDEHFAAEVANLVREDLVELEVPIDLGPPFAHARVAAVGAAALIERRVLRPDLDIRVGVTDPVLRCLARSSTQTPRARSRRPPATSPAQYRAASAQRKRRPEPGCRAELQGHRAPFPRFREPGAAARLSISPTRRRSSPRGSAAHGRPKVPNAHRRLRSRQSQCPARTLSLPRSGRTLVR